MPVVITDYTNRVWAVEQPNDGYLHVGFTGKPGPRLTDVLDFIETRSKQFEKFVQKRKAEEVKNAQKRRSALSREPGGNLQQKSGGNTRTPA
jgi:hypothetical protein